MFEARLQDSSVFKKIIDSIKDLVKTVNIDINSKGLFIQAMDTCHVALVALQLKQKAFTYFNCQKPITLGLTIENVSKILKLAGSDDSMILSCQEDPSTVKFKFQSKRGDKISEFNLNLINIDSQSLGIPQTHFTSVSTLPSGQFLRICRQFGTLSQTIKIQTNKDNIRFSVTGQMGAGNTVLSHKQSGQQNEQVLLDIDEPVSLSFASRYLNMFSKASGLSSQVVLNMSGETPLLVEYKLNDNVGQIKYYLAPKITEEQ